MYRRCKRECSGLGGAAVNGGHKALGLLPELSLNCGDGIGAKSPLAASRVPSSMGLSGS